MKSHKLLPLPCRAAMAGLAVLACTAGQAHVTLTTGSVAAGTHFIASFRVGHPCKDSAATTGITVSLPEGFGFMGAEPRAGWTQSTEKNQVSWKASSAQAAVPAGQTADFSIHGMAPATPGPVWFKVLQTCDKGVADWSQVPLANGAGKLEFPAARLEVLREGASAPAGGPQAAHEHSP